MEIVRRLVLSSMEWFFLRASDLRLIRATILTLAPVLRARPWKPSGRSARLRERGKNDTDRYRAFLIEKFVCTSVRHRQRKHTTGTDTDENRFLPVRGCPVAHRCGIHSFGHAPLCYLRRPHGPEDHRQAQPRHLRCRLLALAQRAHMHRQPRRSLGVLCRPLLAPLSTTPRRQPLAFQIRCRRFRPPSNWRLSRPVSRSRRPRAAVPAMRISQPQAVPRPRYRFGRCRHHCCGGRR